MLRKKDMINSEGFFRKRVNVEQRGLKPERRNTNWGMLGNLPRGFY